jgi:dipeptidyl aminopeptidase/acylaminoacyl peptidase
VRRDIEFQSKGDVCRGWLYTPDKAAQGLRHPTIVMAHGFSGVKEQALPDFAEQFAAAGFAVLLFDYRTFGASAGEPRCQLLPLDMVEDYRNAITWACGQPNLDADRIGLWGTSYSGGLVAYAATYDKRVKAVVAQAPSLTN